MRNNILPNILFIQKLYTIGDEVRAAPLYCLADEKTDGLNSATSEAIFEAAAAESNEVFTTLWLKMDDSIQPTVARSAA